MKYQKNGKICNCFDWLQDAFAVAIVSGETYEEIIEMFERNKVNLNFYNISIHKHRHCEHKDFVKAEETKALWKAIDAKFNANSA